MCIRDRRLEKEIEKGARMEEIEITSVEDVEELLTPVEPDKHTQQEEARAGMDLLQLWELMKKEMDKNKVEMKEDNKRLDKKLS